MSFQQIGGGNSGGNFDRIAPIYDILARLIFGENLQNAQLVWLNEIPANASVLIVGGGTGLLLEQVLLRCQPRQVVYLDTSAAMVSRASQRMLKKNISGLVKFWIGDVATLSAEPPFDVILTPFFIDLFSNETLRSSVLPQLQNHMAIGGVWIVTDFVETSSWWQMYLLKVMIRFFRFTANIETTKLANWQQLLEEIGLIRLKQQQSVAGMVSTEVWQRPD